MRFEPQNPTWRTDVAQALEEAATRQRALVLKPLGQGLGADDEW